MCYMAPEALSGEQYCGKKSDVWALGVILYSLIEGSLPFENKLKDELREEICKAKVTFEGPAWQNASPAFVDLVSGMLDHNPTRRLSAFEVSLHPWLSSPLAVKM